MIFELTLFEYAYYKGRETKICKMMEDKTFTCHIVFDEVFLNLKCQVQGQLITNSDWLRNVGNPCLTFLLLFLQIHENNVYKIKGEIVFISHLGVFE